MTDLILDARNIDLHYGKVQVLFDVSIKVARGEFVALLGTNGAGKSTFLKAVSNLSPVTSGRVVFDGNDITDLPPDAIAARGLAHIPGGRGTLPDLTVEENLRLGGYLLRHDKDLLAAGIDRAVTLFPWMGARRRQLAGTLSGGEQQMLAIGRGLMAEPILLILDEPSLGLSPLLVEELFALIQRINGQGIALLLVEQNVVQSLEVAHRAYILENGSVVLDGASDHLRNDPNLKRAYLGL